MPEEIDDFYGSPIPGHYEHITEHTTVDIDVHRYKCTQCGAVMYYSGGAKQYYEQGKAFELI